MKISPQATPPVCKLMNYGKYKFEQSKREKEARKNQHVVEIKEIRMSPGIDVGDFNTKLKNAQKFLADGNRVKVICSRSSQSSAPKLPRWTKQPSSRAETCPCSSPRRRVSKTKFSAHAEKQMEGDSLCLN